MNSNAKDILRNSLLAAFGLVMFGFGVYLTIQANIGAAPWDAFNLGLSKTFGISYGTASISVSFVIVIIDIILRERIGIGMFLDAVLVGKAVDLFNYLGLVPYQKNIFCAVPLMLVGLVIMGFAQYIYMKAALGCGPRDSLLVGLKRRTRRVPIGAISIIMLATVTLIAYFLGGPIGIGTLICALLIGPIMQLDFRIVRFDPTLIEHQDIVSSFKILFGHGR